MRHGVSNFEQDIFPDNPSFRTIQAYQLRGRIRNFHEWRGMTWWPRFHATTSATGGGGSSGAVPLLESSGQLYHSTRPSIFGQVFEPLEDPGKITRHKDRWEIRLTSPALVGAAETKVQVRGGRLRVVARSQREFHSRGSSVAGWKGDSFEYETVLPRGFRAKEISAKRDGSTMVITVPFTPPRV